MLCHGSCSSCQPGSAPAGPQCSSRELIWNGLARRSHFAVLFIGYSGFFPTTASVTVTPKWLHSSSKCRDERQTLKWPGTPCSHVNQCSVEVFWGWKKRQRRNVSVMSWWEKIIISSCKVEGIWCRAFWGTPCPLSLSLLVSLQIFLVQVFSQAALNCACLQFVFLQKDVFANFKPDLQSLKAEVASDAHRFCWILFFPPWHACFQKWVGILPEMSTATPTFGELFFPLLLYMFSLISGGREPTGIYHSISHPLSLQQLPAFAWCWETQAECRM